MEQPLISPAPVADLRPTFTANFEILVTGIRTTTVGDLTNVVKQVEWIMKGTQDGQMFELPQKTDLAAPDSENFVPLESITDPAVIVGWIEATEPNMYAIKSHIQLVLDKMVAEASSVSAPLPWAPALTEPVAPPAAV